MEASRSLVGGGAGFPQTYLSVQGSWSSQLTILRAALCLACQGSSSGPLGVRKDAQSYPLFCLNPSKFLGTVGLNWRSLLFLGTLYFLSRKHESLSSLSSCCSSLQSVGRVSSRLWHERNKHFGLVSRVDANFLFF